MDSTRTALFDLADRRLAWIGRRQEMLAQNIANADTPGWKARDIKPFAELLARSPGTAPLLTHPGHLASRRAPPDGRTQNGEHAPDGNSVVLDAELGKVADTETAHSLVTGLYSKYLGMFRIAAGR